MGAPGAMSTPPESDRFVRSFSGKISPVTKASEESLPTAPPLEPPAAKKPPAEIGGRSGPEPTRFGDWELQGRCIDF
jgi:hypothetical protein